MKKEIGLYELVLLFSYTATEKEIVERVEYYRDSLLKKGSQVMVKNYGKISLAYPIKGFDTATSVQLIYLGNGNLINQLQTEIAVSRVGNIRQPNQPMYRRFSVEVIHAQNCSQKLALSRRCKVVVMIMFV